MDDDSYCNDVAPQDPSADTSSYTGSSSDYANPYAGDGSGSDDPSSMVAQVSGGERQPYKWWPDPTELQPVDEEQHVPIAPFVNTNSHGDITFGLPDPAPRHADETGPKYADDSPHPGQMEHYSPDS